MRTLEILTAVGVALALAVPAAAFPVDLDVENTPEQDFLWAPNRAEELGIAFPPDENIQAYDTPTNDTACNDPPGDDPAITNALVIMTNMTTRNFTDVWYVADAAWTTITNLDGKINMGMAFKIDTVGVNRPLVFEDMIPDDIFQAGETWHFILQDYQNVQGLAPSAFFSMGLVGAGSDGDPTSSGSIVAIPEPASMAVLALGGLGVLLKRRRHS